MARLLFLGNFRGHCKLNSKNIQKCTHERKKCSQNKQKIINNNAKNTNNKYILVIQKAHVSKDRETEKQQQQQLECSLQSAHSFANNEFCLLNYTSRKKRQTRQTREKHEIEIKSNKYNFSSMHAFIGCLFLLKRKHIEFCDPPRFHIEFREITCRNRMNKYTHWCMVYAVICIDFMPFWNELFYAIFHLRFGFLVPDQNADGASLNTEEQSERTNERKLLKIIIQMWRF